MSDDLSACARIVEKGDPMRFRAVMTAPPAAREKLFPLYAFNVEVARAPWITSEPGIAEIRLQWWIDALEEIAAGGTVRRHEVVVPLALVIAPAQARALQALIEARMRDVYGEPFADLPELLAYLNATAGTLLETAAAMLGQRDPAPARAAGLAQGVAGWLSAVPALKKAGRVPLPDESREGIGALVGEGLAALEAARQGPIDRPARPAFHVMAGVGHMLTRARASRTPVFSGTLEPGPAKLSYALMKAALLGRW